MEVAFQRGKRWEAASFICQKALGTFLSYPAKPFRAKGCFYAHGLK